ncbi:MAG: aldo/keto reductase [Desulfocapsaceae bacterium]
MNIYFNKGFERIFGTYPLTGEVLRQALEYAAEAGYRAFDTAQQYENEKEIGEFIASSAIPRNQLCITTKVCPSKFTESKFIRSVEESLKSLQLDTIDILLVHWPPVGGDIKLSLELLEKAYHQGLAKNIGVSNYTVQMMRDTLNIINAPVVINQVEYHPLIDQSVLLKAAAETGIPLSSYCSLARAEVPKRPIFDEIGRTYGKSGNQIALRWILQKGVPVITMSTKLDNIRANFDVMDFTLSSIDMDRIEALTVANYRVITLKEAPWAPKWDMPCS